MGSSRSGSCNGIASHSAVGNTIKHTTYAIKASNHSISTIATDPDTNNNTGVNRRIDNRRSAATGTTNNSWSRTKGCLVNATATRNNNVKVAQNGNNVEVAPDDGIVNNGSLNQAIGSGTGTGARVWGRRRVIAVAVNIDRVIITVTININSVIITVNIDRIKTSEGERVQLVLKRICLQ